MLAYAEVNVAALPVFGREVFLSLDLRLCGGSQVGRTAHYVGQGLGDCVKNFAAARTGGFGLVERGQLALNLGPVGLHAAHKSLIFGGKFGVRLFIAGEQLVPFVLFLRALFGNGEAVLLYVLRHFKGRALPAQVLLCRLKVCLAQGRAVTVGRACKGGAVAYDRLAYDDCRSHCLCLCALYGVAQHKQVVGVGHAENLPALRNESRRHVLREGVLHIAFNGGVVAVVEEDEFAQLLGACKGAGLVSDTLFKAAVARQYVGIVVYHEVAGSVEQSGKVRFSHCKTHSIAHALAKGAGRGLHAVSLAVFGVAGRARTELAEVYQVLFGHVVTEEVEERIQQHRTMPRGEDKSVSVFPFGIAVAEVKMFCKQLVPDRRRAHADTGVAGVGSLNGLCRQDSDSVYAFLLNSHFYISL